MEYVVHRNTIKNIKLHYNFEKVDYSNFTDIKAGQE